MRTARHNVSGVVYHLIWRFVDRHWLFECEEERARYLDYLGRALESSDWRCIGYALMSNHLHHAMVAGEEPLEHWAKRAHSPFAAWMNRRRGWLGSIMADRPKDRAVPDDDVVHLLAYIHNNPVRAGVVVRAAESSWTSHRAYLGVVECPGWLHVDEGLRRSGLPDARTFDAWVDANPGKAEYLELAKIRREARRRGAVELATPTGGARPHVPLVARPFARLRTDPRLVINAVANIIGVSASEMCSRIRSRVAIDGRAAAVHCGKALGIRGSDLAAALGVSAAAVSQIGARPVTPDQARLVRIALERIEIEQTRELKTVPGHA